MITMKCLVINLKRAFERKKYISSQLEQLSLDYEFIEGVDWKDLDLSSLPTTTRNVSIKNSFRTLTSGEIGCNLSHRKVLKRLTKSSEKMVAVLEDDVRLSKEFPEVLNALEDSSKYFDLVFLGSSFKPGETIDLASLNEEFHFSISMNIQKGAWGYVITKKAAKEFLKCFPEITGPIDDTLHAYSVHGLRTYLLNPKIVFHDEEAKKFSFIRETKRTKKLSEEAVRFVLKYYERYSHKQEFRKRIKSVDIDGG